MIFLTKQCKFWYADHMNKKIGIWKVQGIYMPKFEFFPGQEQLNQGSIFQMK